MNTPLIPITVSVVKTGPGLQPRYSAEFLKEWLILPIRLRRISGARIETGVY